MNAVNIPSCVAQRLQPFLFPKITPASHNCFFSRLPQAGEAAPEQQQSLGTVGDQGMLRPRDLDKFFLQVRRCPQGPPSPARGHCGALNATKLLVTGCVGGKKASKSRGGLRGKTDFRFVPKITEIKRFHHWDKTVPSPG